MNENLMKVNVKTNSFGFRDKEYSLSKTDKYRYLFLGDSLTFGWGVSKENTFEDIIEEKYQSRIEIINLGIGNYNTEKEVKHFFDYGAQFNPDEVVLFYFINDAEEIQPPSNLEFLESSQLITFFWSMMNLTKNVNFVSFYKDIYTEKKLLKIKESLKKLNDYCLKKEIKLKLVILPELHQFKPYLFSAEHSKILDLVNELKIPNIDITTNFERYAGREQELWVARDDAHPNAIAHELIAKSIEKFIIEGSNE